MPSSVNSFRTIFYITVRRLTIIRKCDAFAGLAFDALHGSVGKLQRRNEVIALPFEAFKSVLKQFFQSWHEPPPFSFLRARRRGSRTAYCTATATGLPS